MTGRNVIFFNPLLLPASETFIRSQGEQLRRFTPYYVGARRVPGLDLPAERTFAVNGGGPRGKAAEGWFKYTGQAPHLDRLLRPCAPVLIHAHFGVGGGLALPLARRLGLPLLVTYHGTDEMQDEHLLWASHSHRIYRSRRAALQQEAGLFVAVSRFVRSKLLEQGFDPAKIQTHYIGVDTDRFAPRPGVVREPVVLFVGRLCERKGTRYLIEAMAQVRRTHPELELVVIGDGALRTRLEAQARDCLGRYRFLGVQSPDAVRQWMNRARVLVLPSVTVASGDTEGFGIVLLEAQAMGLPVVGTHHGGIPEALADGETGFLVPERNAGALAVKIERLLEVSLWEQFSHEARRRTVRDFNLARQTARLESFYERLLPVAPRPSRVKPSS